MPITQTTDVAVNSTPKNLVSELTLDAGNYRVQNTGPVAIRYRLFDAPVTDVNTLGTTRGHRLKMGADVSINTTGGDAVYVFTEGDKTSSVAITKES